MYEDVWLVRPEGLVACNEAVSLLVIVGLQIPDVFGLPVVVRVVEAVFPALLAALPVSVRRGSFQRQFGFHMLPFHMSQGICRFPIFWLIWGTFWLLSGTRHIALLWWHEAFDFGPISRFKLHQKNSMIYVKSASSFRKRYEEGCQIPSNMWNGNMWNPN